MTTLPTTLNRPYTVHPTHTLALTAALAWARSKENTND